MSSAKEKRQAKKDAMKERELELLAKEFGRSVRDEMLPFLGHNVN
jgi:hypothetical protein